MRFRLTRAMTAVALAAGAIACDDAGPTAPVTETPVTETVTETYSGTLNRNGAVTFPFAVGAAGTATATLAGLTPNTVAVGFTMGTWNGVACASVIANDNATEFAQIVGSAGSAGNLCLRIHDVGRLSAPLTFTITVKHP